MKTPVQLAEELVKVLGDSDDNTAGFALQIAQLLVSHRRMACLDFEQACIGVSHERS